MKKDGLDLLYYLLFALFIFFINLRKKRQKKKEEIIDDKPIFSKPAFSKEGIFRGSRIPSTSSKEIFEVKDSISSCTDLPDHNYSLSADTHLKNNSNDDLSEERNLHTKKEEGKIDISLEDMVIYSEIYNNPYI